MEYSFINDLERDALVRFNLDPMMKEAVRKVILAYIYNSGLLKPGQPVDSDKHWVYSLFNYPDAVKDDALLGRLLKIKVDASSMLEDGFRKLSEFKAEEITPVKQESNPGE